MNPPEWIPQVIGGLASLGLSLWIPVSVFRTRKIWDKNWKRYVWTGFCALPVTNILITFPLYLFHVSWRVAASWKAALRWCWRAASVLPVLNAVMLSVLSRREKDKPLRPLANVTAVYAGVAVLGFVLAVVGRPPVVAIAAGATHTNADLAMERAFLAGRDDWRPKMCVSLSGGGIRSAAFSLGVLQALHERGILAEVDVISAVSGGTYALSWLVLQPYYATADKPRRADAVTPAIASMFNAAGPYQRYLREHSGFVGLTEAGWDVLFDATIMQTIRSFNVTAFGGEEMIANGTMARKMYREKIQEAFHGHPAAGPTGDLKATNRLALKPEFQSQPNSLWIVKNVTFSELGKFLKETRAAGGAIPFPVFNVNLNVRADASLAEQIRPKTAELTPVGMSAPAIGFVPWEDGRDPHLEAVHSANIAPAISGAAVSGFAQPGSAIVRLLLRAANTDLGYYVRNVFSDDPRSIYLSDGGHAENLGLYALVRRECGKVLVVDAEYEAAANDGGYVFEAFERVRTGVQKEKLATIEMQAGSPRESFDPAKPVLKGVIRYANRPGPPAPLVYVKLALDRGAMSGLPRTVTRYATPEHPAFPHDPTTDQEFTPDQFRAYQGLGRYLACHAEPLGEWSKRPCAPQDGEG
jgi:hypothetical protein